MGKIAELDVVEVTSDLPLGLVEGARGTVMAINGDNCTVEFLDCDGYTIGLFEISAGDLEIISSYPASASVARED
jgi:hypothetical protein